MKVLSLFSGIGGFDLGFQRAGMEVVGMCEIDKHAQKILQRRFPDATLYTDVRKVRYERRSIDLICGGFPCQDLSVAGKRRGLDGERSGLWFEFARIIDDAEPAWVVIENVPGLFSSNGGRDFAVIVDWLAQRGYGVGWRVLDAQGFGLAQRRKRVFIVASFGSPRGCTILLEHESVQRNPKPSRASRQGDSGATQDGTNSRVSRVSHTLTTCYDKTWYYNSATFLPMVETLLWQATTPDSIRISAADISPTLPARMGTGGHNVPFIGVRRLTPTECERLQGFPDGWTDGQADTQRYKQLGNAVAVPVAEWIGRRIMEVTK